MLSAMHAPAFTCADVYEEAGPPKGFVFIVDPMSSGNQLAPVYLERGLYPIFIRSNIDLVDRVKSGLKPHDFLETIPPHIHEALMSGDQKRIEKAVRELLPGLKAMAIGEQTPIYVLAGHEVGVPTAERLAVSLGLQTYDKDFIRAHHSKPHMQWALKDGGLQIIPFTTAKTSDQAIAWIRKELKGIDHVGGVIVKTGLGHSGAQVVVCHTEAEVAAAVNQIVGVETPGKTVNRSVMIQPLVKGREFAVNSVSVYVEGKLYTVITDVWEYIKPAPPAYGYEILLTPEEIPAGLLEKHLGVKEALHYRNGPGHGEHFVASEETIKVFESLGMKRENGGMILNGEIGHRMYGAGDTDISGASTRYGQVEGTVDASDRPEEIVRRAKEWAATGQPYDLTHRSIVYNVNAPKSDKQLYANMAVWDQLRKEFGDKIYKMNVYVTEGMTLAETHNLVDSMAQVKLRVPRGEGDKAELLRMVNRIQQLQAEGAFWSETP